MKKLLVASVYASSERNPVWWELQRRYFERTVGERNYDHLILLNRASPDLFAGSRAIMMSGSQEQTTQIDDHLAALNRILAYFLENRNRYEHFMVIDSDAFPFRANWLDTLVSMMRAHSWQGPGLQPATWNLPERYVAAVVQSDHFNVYFHPSAIFIRGDALRSDSTCVEFRAEEQRNFLGMQFRELVVASKVPVLPLVRTNYANPHPMLAGIYGGLVYHHGAGSRGLFIRAIDSGYFDHLIPRQDHAALADRLHAALVRDPEAFLAYLAGTNRFEGLHDPLEAEGGEAATLRA